MATNPPSFERAEYGTASMGSCARCYQTLRGRYFRLDGQTLCEPCANMAVKEPAQGAQAAFVKAIGVGVVAAIIGCALYAAIEILTGWMIGYVALAVGWMIGKGMKWAAEGRGGIRYQVAAAVLTYLSVSVAELAVLLHQVLKQNPEEHLRFSAALLPFVLKYGLLSPFLELQDGVNGVIGLVILFIGIRAAWALTAGSEYRISGPYQAPAEVSA